MQTLRFSENGNPAVEELGRVIDIWEHGFDVVYTLGKPGDNFFD